MSPDASQRSLPGRAVTYLLLLVLAGIAVYAYLTVSSKLDERSSEQTRFLFAQTAPSGTFAPVKGRAGTYTLTLNGASPSTTYFSDRPERIAGSVLTSSFVTKNALFSEDDPPNAAVVLQNPQDDKQDVVTVELTKPAYDANTRRLTYRATLLGEAQGSLKHWAGASDDSLPARFGEASVFIDAAPLYELSFTVKDSQGNPIPNTTVKYTPGGEGDFTTATTDSNGRIDSFVVYGGGGNGTVILYTVFPGKICNATDPDFQTHWGTTGLVTVWYAEDSTGAKVPNVTMQFDNVTEPWKMETQADGAQSFGLPYSSYIENFPINATVTLPGTICAAS